MSSNLPPNRKQEIEAKRQALKDQVEVTLRLRQEQARPMGEVMKYIAEEGIGAQDEATRRRFDAESAAYSARSHAQRMNDCSDGGLRSALTIASPLKIKLAESL